MITGFAFGRFAPGKSVLHRMDPSVKIISVALLVSIGFLSRGLCDLLTVAAVVSLALLASNPDLRKIWSDFRALYLLYLVTIVLHAILNPGTALVDLPFGLVITSEGLQRGVYFAVKIAMTLGIPISHNLKKIHVTKPQKVFQNSLLKGDNVAGAFEFKPESGVRGKSVLLIDDICDSGATIKEIGKLLSQLGAIKVAPLVIAKTVGGDLAG